MNFIFIWKEDFWSKREILPLLGHPSNGPNSQNGAELIWSKEPGASLDSETSHNCSVVTVLTLPCSPHWVATKSELKHELKTSTESYKLFNKYKRQWTVCLFQMCEMMIDLHICRFFVLLFFNIKFHFPIPFSKLYIAIGYIICF